MGIAIRRPANLLRIGVLVLLAAAAILAAFYLPHRGRRPATTRSPLETIPAYQIAQGHSASDREARTEVDMTVSRMLAGIPQHGNALGQPTAPITLQIYGDLECFSVRHWFLYNLPRILTEFVRSNVMRIEYHSLETDTLNSSVFIVQQAAAGAAGTQNKLWNFIDTFYSEQGIEYTRYVTNAFLNSIANQVPDLHGEQWATDANNRSRKLAVIADDRFARAVGFHDTPAFRLGRTGGPLHDFSGRRVVVFHKPLVTRTASGERTIIGEKHELGHPLSEIDWYDLRKAIKSLI